MVALSEMRELANWCATGELGDELGSIGQVELAEDVGEVGFDGATGDEQTGSDLWVGESVGDEPTDVGFHRCERVPAERGAAWAMPRAAQAKGA